MPSGVSARHFLYDNFMKKEKTFIQEVEHFSRVLNAENRKKEC